MFHFRKNKSLQVETTSAIGSDFIVHNMPVAISRPVDVSPVTSGGVNLGSAGFVPITPKHNFKMVGLIIILGGLVVVSVFIYFSYRFIVRPTALVNSPINTATSTSDQGTSNSSEPVVSTSTEELASTTPSEVVSATPEVINATATSSGEVPLSEESLGRDGTGLPPVVDTDQDGLTDDEEAVFGTLSTNADSDTDNYNDLVEIQKGYNPMGPGTLDTNVNLSKYINATLQYEVLVPKNWPSQTLNNEATVIFTAPDDSLLQISVQDNTDQASILNWYSQSFPESIATYDKLKSNDYYDGIRGEGDLNFYLTDKNRQHIFVISYIPAVNNRLAYTNVFKLLIDSLVIK